MAATAALAAGAALVVAAPAAAPLLARASAEPCPDTAVIFARGTSEAPGIGRVGDAFVNSLRSKLPGESVEAYGVNYPASYNFLEAVNGANDVSGYVQHMVDTCPDTRLVLGGYSQGAAVMDIVTAAPIGGIAVSQPLPPGAADHVAAVALFGNPSKHLGGLQTSLSPDYAGKTIDLCDGADPICSNGDNWSAHTQYVQSGLTNQAAAFVAARL